jgi:squalene-hopene/tetraprenyl-beta-curcumene cyclase
LCPEDQLQRLRKAARRAAGWLLRRQNANGGWPTFCQGPERLPWDQSATDVTACVLRALNAWRDLLGAAKISPAISHGLDFLAQRQDTDGSWVPLWFGNQDRPDRANPVCGTAHVLLAYRDLGRLDADQPRRALAWLRRAQNVDGGWSCGYAREPSGKETVGPSSVEETSLALQALLAAHSDPAWQVTIERGLDWLLEAVETRRYVQPVPVGLLLPGLWYYDRLIPLVSATSALTDAVDRLVPATDRRSAEPPLLSGSAPLPGR